jgi:type I restriction enzyme S subunit
MNVPKGYKMTEVGVIPEDWEVCRIGDIANVTRGASPRPIDSPIWFDDSSLVGWVRISDVTRSSKFLEETTQKLSMLGIKQSRFVKQNSLIMSICATVGRPILTKIDVCIHDGFVVFSNLDLEEEYLYYLLLSIEKDWSKNGQIGSQMNLNTELINSTLIPIPKNRREQRSIAQVLSDTDELINALDKLIAKKRDIKKAVMQELLTGKTRLPGFSGEWEVKRLGDLLDYEQPTNYLVKDAKYSDTNSIPVLTAGKTFILGYTDEDFGIFQDLPVIIFDDFTTASRYVDFPFKVKSSAMKMLKAKTTQINLRLVYELMQMIDFPIADHKRHWIKQYQNIEIVIPHPAEQQAIAQILSDIDSEITALEQRRDKMKAIKQGKMQELLTGRIRLK